MCVPPKNNFMCAWTSENHLEPVCPDVLINPIFQVLSDEGPVPGSLLIVNVCQSEGHFVHSKTELLLALHTRQDSKFSYSFWNTTKNHKTIESAHHSFGLLLKDCRGPLTLKWCNSFTCTSTMCKRSLFSGWPSYMEKTKALLVANKEIGLKSKCRENYMFVFHHQNSG
jgi:hypothetical protein